MSDASQAVSYALYYSKYCYFCQKVLMKLRNKNHAISLLDVSDRTVQMQLVAGGGKGQVPCLLIQQDQQQQWMYESNDILDYIQQQNLAT